MAETVVNVGDTVTGVTVQDGDDQRVYGTADNTTVNNNGFQEINGGTSIRAAGSTSTVQRTTLSRT